jgi:hypothetical protein
MASANPYQAPAVVLDEPNGLLDLHRRATSGRTSARMRVEVGVPRSPVRPSRPAASNRPMHAPIQPMSGPAARCGALRARSGCGSRLGMEGARAARPSVDSLRGAVPGSIAARGAERRAGAPSGEPRGAGSAPGAGAARGAACLRTSGTARGTGCGRACGTGCGRECGTGSGRARGNARGLGATRGTVTGAAGGGAGAGAVAGAGAGGSGARAGGGGGGRKARGSWYSWRVPASRTPKWRWGAVAERVPLVPTAPMRSPGDTWAPARTAREERWRYEVS